eukprot:gene48289-59143_t
MFSDGGTEFLGKFQKVCKEAGIAQETTPPYTPQTNGLVERYWQTLFGMARALLLSAPLAITLKYWTFAVMHANDILNRVTIHTVDGKIATPHEHLYGTKPSLADMKQWGCAVTALVHTQLRENTSLLPHGKRAYFLGLSQKVSNGAVIVSIDYNGVRRLDVVDRHDLHYHEIVDPRYLVHGGQRVLSDLPHQEESTTPYNNNAQEASRSNGNNYLVNEEDVVESRGNEDSYNFETLQIHRRNVSDVWGLSQPILDQQQ